MPKQHAPATLRNREPIAAVLARELPASGTVLEVAAGTGEHAVFFAETFPALRWQPTDPSPEGLASIAAYRADYPGSNIAAPLVLYGPYIEAGVETAPSNLDFDASLKARNPLWGLREAEALDALAGQHGMARTARYAMPANNIMLVYRSA